MPFMLLNERYFVKCAAFIRDPLLKLEQFDIKNYIIFYVQLTLINLKQMKCS